ncbi:GLPGLI family protein [Cellulophaga lytica]|uniref:GLPGLI family protein n=1 Tax=Cellulophaga lytica TaxID=979 RepID=UPI0026E2B7E0|nr:GLPGLI family protein [Cellulophaga lytica]MDO6852359.1 GLPGLI family protein [Cellulophaga lytica]
MKHFIVLIFFSLSIISAQTQKGKATYKLKHPQIDVVDTTKKPSTMGKQITESIKTAQELIAFNLAFNNKESVFYREEKLYTNLDKFTKGMIDILSKGNYYSNIATNEKLKSTSFDNKNYIVNIYQPQPWKITDTTKTILGYTCHKATLTKTNKKTTKDYTVEAWFSKDIPYYFGPDEYNGLPGLILELKLNPKQTIYCASVQLQTKKNKLLTKPTEGTYINSNEEFEDIVKTLASKAKQKH